MKQALASIVVVILNQPACGHAPTPAPPIWQPPSPAAVPATLSWEVMDRFRLLNPSTNVDETEDVFARFKDLYDYQGTPVSPWRSPSTAWDQGKAAYKAGYVGVSSWTIRFDAHLPGQCEWTFRGDAKSPAAGPIPGPCSGLVKSVGSPVHVEVHPLGGPPTTITATIEPRDVLIASLGDSYASGEGVPNLARHWLRGAFWVDERCHRSLFSGPGLAALEYAHLNKHVSVTHLSFACSGATLNHQILEGYADGGILLPYSGAAKKDRPPLEPQVEALRKALTLPDGSSLKANYLTLTIGGNDIGFGEAVRTATTGDKKDLTKVVDRWTKDAEARFSPPWMAHLRSALDDAHASAKWGTRTFVTSYPDPTSVVQSLTGGLKERDLVEVCGSGSGGQLTLAPPYTIASDKAKFLHEGLAVALEKNVAAVRAALETDVPSPDEMAQFNQHGFCAMALGLPYVRTRWINRVPDSLKLQGSMPYLLGVLFDGEGEMGAMHPNIRGQAEFARLLLERILKNECDSKQHLIAETDPDFSLMCGADQRWRREIPGAVPAQ